VVDVQEFCIFVHPTTYFSCLDIALNNGQTCLSAYFLQIIEVAFKEVAEEFLENLLEFIMELYNIEIRVIFFHFFDGTSTVTLHEDNISG
jgi:hypothetical protein